MSKKVIIVTGTPGTGKTTLAKHISEEKGYIYLDLKDLIEEHNLNEGYDEKRRCAVVDIEKLNKILIPFIEKINKPIVIDSHMSHFLPKEIVDEVMVCKCDLKVLKERLEKRGYTDEKVRENLDVEIFDICLNEARENGHVVVVYDCSFEERTKLDI